MQENDIKKIFEKAISKKVQSLKVLGKGASNVNYLITADNQKFVFRINANSRRPEKSEKEFNSLKILESLGIGPKPLYLGKNFMILEYIEGQPFKGNSPDIKFLKKLANLVADIHNLKPSKSLPHEQSSVKGYEMDIWLKNLKQHLKSPELLDLILKTRQKLIKLEETLKNYPKSEVVTHGDICGQNVLKTKKGGLALIDFEDVGLKDPAEDIAKIFVDFRNPFTKSQKNVFLKEYFKKRTDKTLLQRISIYETLIIFIVFVWSIDYILRIQNKEMHSSYLTKKELNEGIKYTKVMLKRCINFNIISKEYSKFNINKIFP
jgi:thiamine kinase-like enzyme